MRQYAVKVNDKEYPVTLISRQGEVIEFEIAGKNYSTKVSPAINLINASALQNQTTSSSTTNGNINAPMPGIIVSIAKSEDDKVTAGDNILVIEAMKMENNITASKTGIIKKIHVKAGQEVENGQPLVTIE